MATLKKKGGTRQRTIAVELHRQWRKLERKGDTTLLAAELNVSKPTIDKALIYGCVHQQAIIDGINKFFSDRLERELESAKQLGSLDAQVNRQDSVNGETYRESADGDL